LVWSVDKTKCPVSAALTPISAVSKSRSRRQDELGLAKEGGRAAAEVQADLFLHLNLVNARQLELDGIFRPS